jgi:hypothetical protein
MHFISLLLLAWNTLLHGPEGLEYFKFLHGSGQNDVRNETALPP